jgi:hypothetical protein
VGGAGFPILFSKTADHPGTTFGVKDVARR